MFQFIKRLFGGKREPEHLRRGRLGEAAAKRHLKSAGLKFLVANFKTKDSEIDLVFRDDDCLVFVEVKARTEGGWTRPAAAVGAEVARAQSSTAFASDARSVAARPSIDCGSRLLKELKFVSS